MLCRDDSYVALKILSGYYTDFVERGRVWELGALEKVSSPPSSLHCLQLKSRFTFAGKYTYFEEFPVHTVAVSCTPI